MDFLSTKEDIFELRVAIDLYSLTSKNLTKLNRQPIISYFNVITTSSISPYPLNSS